MLLVYVEHHEVRANGIDLKYNYFIFEGYHLAIAIKIVLHYLRFLCVLLCLGKLFFE